MKIDHEAFARVWNNHKISTQRIADTLGVTRAAVSWRAHHMGLPTRAKLRRRKADPELLRRLWLAGVSAKEIAQHFGMSHHSCAVTAARKLGLPRRERGPAGRMNGGWKANLPIAEFWDQQAAAAMAEDAARTRAALERHRMVDGTSSKNDGAGRPRRLG